MRYLRWLVLFLFFALLSGFVLEEEGEPRNIRFRAQVVGDTVFLDLRWNAPSRQPGQTPITGYQWEVWTSDNDTLPLGTLVSGGATTDRNDRQVSIILPFICESTATFYIGRVRALGSFSSVPPWGNSDQLMVPCDNSPPGPPIVTLDTLLVDTLPATADSGRFLPIALGEGASWDLGENRLTNTALGSTTSMCYFTFRDGSPYFLFRDQWVATMDSTVVTTESDVMMISDGIYPDLACWDWVAVGNGFTQVYFCTTDCPVVLAGFTIPIPRPALPKRVIEVFALLGMVLFFFHRQIDHTARRVWDGVRGER
jgi:hypothetical protein